jgi:cytochrome c
VPGILPRLVATIVSALLIGMGSSAARAQIALPTAAPPSGEALFRRQCAACHTVNTAEPQRQGPALSGIVGRKAGTVAGFRYSAGFARADWVWDTERLDSWLVDPQAMIPGAIMPYKEARREVRSAIINYLKELH